jgi:hypothetical protein
MYKLGEPVDKTEKENAPKEEPLEFCEGDAAARHVAAHVGGVQATPPIDRKKNHALNYRCSKPGGGCSE